MYIPAKTDLTTTLPAAEFNQFLTELQTNLITPAGMTPTSGSLNQVGVAVASIAAQGGVFGVDSGIADAYVFTQVSPFPAPFALKNGMTISFRPGNNNTGACTINAFGFGAKSIKNADGSTPTASALSTLSDVKLRYDLTLDEWLIDSNINAQATTTTAGASLLPSQIIISNNVTDSANDIDFAAGNFQFSDGTGSASLSALIKRLDATWAAGTNQGGLFTGAKANSTWYHCFAIYNPTTGVSDCGFDTSVTAANIPSGYTKYKRVGSIRTNGSGNILAFLQTEKYFALATSLLDITNASQTIASETLRTLTIPLGVKTIVIGNIQVLADSAGAVIAKVYSADTSSLTLTIQMAYASNNISLGQSYYQALSNTSSQVKTNAIYVTGTPTTRISLATDGWIDLTL
jgi:hypothetical protein